MEEVGREERQREKGYEQRNTAVTWHFMPLGKEVKAWAWSTGLLN
jgi:hypothetical protein